MSVSDSPSLGRKSLELNSVLIWAAAAPKPTVRTAAPASTAIGLRATNPPTLPISEPAPGIASVISRGCPSVPLASER